MSDRSVSFYVGNLRRAKRFYSLNWHHFLMASADEYGNLLKKNILVQYIGCKIDRKMKYLLLCNECNEECSSLQQILMRGELTDQFYNDLVGKYCIHCKVCDEFNPIQIFPLSEGSFPWYFGPDILDVQVIQEKPLLCAVLSGGGYGLISLPARAKYVRCIVPCKDIHSSEFECKIHKSKFDSRDPKKHGWIQSRNVKIYDTEWLPDVERTVYYRPTVGNCHCYQTWTGEEEKVLNISKNQIGKVVHIVSYKILLNYTWSYCKCGSTRHGFYQAHNNRMMFQYGVENEKLILWHIWNSAVTMFWEEIICMNSEQAFMCPECGPRPDYLCMDGVCIGISVDNMRDQKDSDLFLAYSDKPILDAPEYKERMFLKQKKNRDLLKHSCLKNKYPDLRLVKFEKDPGMLVIKDFVQGVKSEGHSDLPREYADVLLDISSFSSTISMLQIQNN